MTSQCQRRRNFNKIHVKSWAISLERTGIIHCLFKNCKFIASDVEEMTLHYKSCNGTQSPSMHLCPHCDRGTSSRDRLLSHISFHHPLQLSAQEKKELEETREIPTRTASKVAKYTWDSIFSIRGYYKCLENLCLFVTEDYELMETHYLNYCRIPSLTLPYVCRFCQGRSTEEKLILDHEKKFHSNGSEKLVSRRLVIDWAEQLKSNGFAKCSTPGCNLYCSELTEMEKHFLDCHDPSPDGLAVCGLCKGWFTNEENKTFHVRIFHEKSNQQGSISIVPISNLLGSEKQAGPTLFDIDEPEIEMGQNLNEKEVVEESIQPPTSTSHRVFSNTFRPSSRKRELPPTIKVKSVRKAPGIDCKNNVNSSVTASKAALERRIEAMDFKELTFRRPAERKAAVPAPVQSTPQGQVTIKGSIQYRVGDQPVEISFSTDPKLAKRKGNEVKMDSSTLPNEERVNEQKENEEFSTLSLLKAKKTDLDDLLQTVSANASIENKRGFPRKSLRLQNKIKNEECDTPEPATSEVFILEDFPWCDINQLQTTLSTATRKDELVKVISDEEEFFGFEQKPLSESEATVFNDQIRMTSNSSPTVVDNSSEIEPANEIPSNPAETACINSSESDEESCKNTVNQPTTRRGRQSKVLTTSTPTELENSNSRKRGRKRKLPLVIPQIDGCSHLKEDGNSSQETDNTSDESPTKNGKKIVKGQKGIPPHRLLRNGSGEQNDTNVESISPKNGRKAKLKKQSVKPGDSSRRKSTTKVAAPKKRGRKPKGSRTTSLRYSSEDSDCGLTQQNEDSFSLTDRVSEVISDEEEFFGFDQKPLSESEATVINDQIRMTSNSSPTVVDNSSEIEPANEIPSNPAETACIDSSESDEESCKNTVNQPTTRRGRQSKVLTTSTPTELENSNSRKRGRKRKFPLVISQIGACSHQKEEDRNSSQETDNASDKAQTKNGKKIVKGQKGITPPHRLLRNGSGEQNDTNVESISPKNGRKAKLKTESVKPDDSSRRKSTTKVATPKKRGRKPKALRTTSRRHSSGNSDSGLTEQSEDSFSLTKDTRMKRRKHSNITSPTPQPRKLSPVNDENEENHSNCEQTPKESNRQRKETKEGKSENTSLKLPEPKIETSSDLEASPTKADETVEVEEGGQTKPIASVSESPKTSTRDLKNDSIDEMDNTMDGSDAEKVRKRPGRKRTIMDQFMSRNEDALAQIDKNIFPQTKVTDPKRMVKCAICKEEMKVIDYQKEHMMKHNFLCWLEDEYPIPLDDYDIMNIVLSRGKRFYPKFIFKCGTCQKSIKSSKGFISHYTICGKTDEEQFSARVICQVCCKHVMPFNLAQHMMQHKSADASEGLSFLGRRNAASEFDSDDSAELYYCNYCEFASVSLKGLTSHIMAHLAGETDSNSSEANVALFYYVEPDSHKPMKAFLATKQVKMKYSSTVELYNNFAVDDSSLRALSSEEASQYIPQAEESIGFTLGDNWTKLNLFNSTATEESKVLFCGGPVWALSWCPRVGNQYLAVSTHRKNISHEFDQIYRQKGLIQLWGFHTLKNKHKPQKDSQPSEFIYGLAHDHGAVWCLQWCPSGGETDSRLGLLALACSDGTVPIFALPMPGTVSSSSRSNQIIVKPKPALVLRLPGEKAYQCFTIAWSKVQPHNTLVGGFSNGLIAIWDIQSTSSLLLRDEGLYPCRTVQAHNSCIISLNMSSTTNDVLVSSALDKTSKLWSLQDLSSPQGIQNKGLVTSSAWLQNLLGVVTTYDNSFTAGGCTCSLATLRNFGSQNTTPIISSVSYKAWDISTSDWSNSCAVAYDNGTVAVVYAISENKKRTMPSTAIYCELKEYGAPGGQPELGIHFHVNRSINHPHMISEDSITENYSVNNSVNRVAFNPNEHSHMTLCMGSNTGLVVVVQLRDTRIKQDIDPW